MNRRSTLALLFVALVALAGCNGKAASHEVHFSGNVTYTGEAFSMDGAVVVLDGSTGPARSYPNVTVTLYAENGTVLDTVPVGDMSARGEAPERRPVRITREYRPAYVLIESQGFWRNGRETPVEAFHWEESVDAYERYSVNSPDERFEEE